MDAAPNPFTDLDTGSPVLGELTRRNRLADPADRLFARLLDAGFIFLACLPGVIVAALFAEAGADGRQPAWVGPSLIAGPITAAAFNLGLLCVSGQTIGKRVMRIRVVDVKTDEHPGWLRIAFLRVLAPYAISAIPCLGPAFAIANVCYIFGADRRCLHDYFAGTKVIVARRERPPAA